MAVIDVFKVAVPDLPPDEVLRRVEAIFPREWLRSPATDSGEQQLLLGLRPRVTFAYTKAKAALEDPSPRQVFEDRGVQVHEVPTAGWALAELAHLVLLAQEEVLLAKADGRRPDLGDDRLLEVEALLRYRKAGFALGPATPLDDSATGPRAEFTVEVAGGSLHVECKNVRDVLNEVEVATLMDAKAMADHIARTVRAHCPIAAVIRLDLGSLKVLPPPGTIIPSVVAAARYALQRLDAVPAPSPGWDDPVRREGDWGQLTILPTLEFMVSDQEGRVADWTRRGIHPFDGYWVSRERGQGGEPKGPGHIPLPRDIVVAVGSIPALRIDELIKRQFEKAARKLRGSREHMIVHVRLNVPEAMADLLSPHGDGIELRRNEGIRRALDRIIGRLPNLPPQIVACEISTLASTGGRPTEGRLLRVSRVLVNERNAQAGRIVRELEDRGVLGPSPERSGRDDEEGEHV